MAVLGSMTLASVLLIGCNATLKHDALMGVQTVLVTYGDVIQPAVLEYEKLPRCAVAKTPACSLQTEVDYLKKIDKTATAAIKTAQPVIDGKASDQGQLALAVNAVIVVQAELNLLGKH
jgi:hypothetical protein